MKSLILTLTAIFFLGIVSCNDAAPKQDATKPAESKKAEAPENTEKPAAAESTSKIRNGIELSKDGLDVEQAFLLYEDGSLVPDGNKVSVGQKVVLRLIMSGWKPDNGKVYLGAAEKITTSEGNIVLDEADLFKEIESVSEQDAKYISLSAVITKLDKLYDYFVVSFKVWDKKSNAEVSGSYKLYLK